MGHVVLIPQDIVEEGKKYLRDRGYTIKMGSGATVEAIKKDAQDSDAILARTAPFPKEVIEAAPKLKVVARHGVGVDNIDVETCTGRGVWVTYAPESNASSVAEYTIGMIVALARNLLRGDKATRTNDFEFRNRIKGADLWGKTLGLVGVGRVGSLVAKKARFGLDMEILVFDPYIKEIKGLPEARFVPDMESVFRNADVVSLHLPATKETRQLVGRRHFEMMKPTSYLINAARGDVIVEKDLYEALKTGKIAGAGLDVYDPEPPKADNPLFSLDNVILSPHNAALTLECMTRMALHAAMGIDDVLSGRRPQWPVNEPKRL